MPTEVYHGPRPRWKTPLSRGRYRVVVAGRYTKVDGKAAAGVVHVALKSRRPVKRRAELLALRTAFLCWFAVAWIENGGTWAEGVRAITEYPFGRLRRRLRQRPRGLYYRA